ncbi:NAD-dependent epimerase/dehydratase family protein [Streptacidiphilus sp. PAMC 29251]
MKADTVYAVLGGGGRLGRRFQSRLHARGYPVVGVSRQWRGPNWLQADLTDHLHRDQALAGLLAALAGHRNVVIADLALDRTSVTSMRQSIAAATSFVLQAREALTAGGATVRVLAAGTTAAMAPPGFQTPYGRAKRRQALA